MRRGAGFEAWLRNRGFPDDVSEVWVGHAVWATGYAAGRWGKPLFEATTAELQQLADSGHADWQEVGPAVTAWFEWLGDDKSGAVNPAKYVRSASGRPRLRLVDSTS
ncbi:MAG TPA: hypothetical protein VM938_10265 [Acidimicrobiales bacterium]|nr:hypothetical protein [Acidimicrobiales bacterium]